MTSLIIEDAKQYGSSEKLAARARLAAKYTISDQPWFAWVASRLPMRDGDRILDVGCGPAWFWEGAVDALPEGIRLTLTDLSTGMVDEAMERCASLPFAALAGQVADAASLPFEDGSFDGVIAMHMLYHVRDPAAAIAEMHRVLKPGGFLGVTTNGADNMRRLHELTAAFGGTPCDPAAAAFGFAEARTGLQDQFGNIESHVHPARLRLTNQDDIFLALTSYPPGNQADDQQLLAFKEAIRSAFAAEGGALEVQKESGLFLAKKAVS
ncbi:class I SAM-dependent methyltransferase [Sphingosinicella rhizophila]|uniref:Class I SAM-dependent methyltransferase n=1 Tax=Sphingosinicella rhizophila TaxID=3050082 RepID=A0ABU3QAR9_9SPHN|nr:class I SAM-dependent methyltransferase [Sphingosinicella sp. GR2756]MDT9600229.1 class I SAM-dependent methyltransferase [Sphingosinicella sp. GR2756]